MRPAPSTTEILVNHHLIALDCAKPPDLVQARLWLMAAATSFAEFLAMFLASRLPEEPMADHSYACSGYAAGMYSSSPRGPCRVCRRTQPLRGSVCGGPNSQAPQEGQAAEQPSSRAAEQPNRRADEQLSSRAAEPAKQPKS